METDEVWAWRPSSRYRSLSEVNWWRNEGPALYVTIEGVVIDLPEVRVAPMPRFTVSFAGRERVLRAVGGTHEYARGPLRWEPLPWTTPPLAHDPSPPQ